MRYLATMLLLAASAATAQQAPSAATPQPHKQPPVVVTGKRICVTRVETGSIMPRTECRTEEQWAEQDERNMAEFQAMKNKQRLDHMIALQKQQGNR